jgi:hypothetical protein
MEGSRNQRGPARQDSNRKAAKYPHPLVPPSKIQRRWLGDRTGGIMLLGIPPVAVPRIRDRTMPHRIAKSAQRRINPSPGSSRKAAVAGPMGIPFPHCGGVIRGTNLGLRPIAYCLRRSRLRRPGIRHRFAASRASLAIQTASCCNTSRSRPSLAGARKDQSQRSAWPQNSARAGSTMEVPVMTLLPSGIWM